MSDFPVQASPKLRILSFFAAIGLLCCATLAVICLGEACFRLYERLQGTPSAAKHTVEAQLTVPRLCNDDTGMIFAPRVEFDYWLKVDGRFIYQAHQKTNAQGFLSREIPEGKLPGVKRIMILGDSYVEGLQVDMEAKLGPVLEGLLNQRQPGGYEVYSFAQSGTGFANQYIYWQKFKDLVKPDALVLVVISNDLKDNFLELTAKAVNCSPIYRSFNFFMLDEREEGGLLQLPPEPWYSSLAPEVFNDPLNTYPAKKQNAFFDWFHLAHFLTGQVDPMGDLDPRQIYKGIYTEYIFFEPRLATDPVVRYGWEISKRVLEKYAREAKQAGIPLIVFAGWPFPTGFVFSGDMKYDVLNDWLKSMSQQLNITFTSLPEEMSRRKLDHEAVTFGNYDYHYNPEGHRLAATILEGPLLERFAPPTREAGQ